MALLGGILATVALLGTIVWHHQHSPAREQPNGPRAAYRHRFLERFSGDAPKKFYAELRMAIADIAGAKGAPAWVGEYNADGAESGDATVRLLLSSEGKFVYLVTLDFGYVDWNMGACEVVASNVVLTPEFSTVTGWEVLEPELTRQYVIREVGDDTYLVPDSMAELEDDEVIQHWEEHLMFEEQPSAIFRRNRTNEAPTVWFERPHPATR